MNKKKVGFIALASMSLFGLIGTVFSTISWFVASVQTPEYNLDGSSAGAYFAYGDGSEEHPYGISIPRHLYNLAWLQYMGQFADGQYYFEIAESVSDETGLNMNGYVLPPIGTEDNPFVGNFNGQGKIITNLTVTNDQSAIFSSSKHPDNTQVEYVAPEIVGLFGVVGNYDSALAPANYDSAVNTIYDLGISNVTVQTTTSKALVGIAAGYVDAPISNVVVNGSTVDINSANTSAVDSENMTANLSDYGIVGYATDSYKKSVTKMEQDLYDITFASPANAEFNASDDGDAQGWGGSINMKTIYNRIVSLRRTKSTDVSAYGNGTFNWRVDTDYYDNEASLPSTTYNNINRSNSTNDAYSRYLGTNESGHEYIGNYNVYARAASNGYGNDTGTYGDQQFLYLCGGHLENHVYHTYYQHTGVLITDGNGNYLNYDGSALGNSTDSDTASLWTFTQYSGSQYYISTTYNGNTVYLYYNNGALGTINSTGTTRRWTVTENGDNMTLVYNTSKIYYRNDNWTLVPTTDQTEVDYYYIKNGNNYISNTVRTGRYNVTNTTNEGSAAQFHVEESTNYVYMMSGTTKYYLTWYRYSNNTNYLNFNTNPTATSYYPFVYNTTYLRANRNGTYRYIRNNGTNWTAETSNYSILLTVGSQSTVNYSTFSIENTFDDDPANRTGPDSHQTTADTTKTNNESHMYYTAEDTTYFPLNVEQDLQSYVTANNTMTSEISNGHLDPKDSNTGYIISGSNIPTNLTTMTHTYSDIRISRYAISSVNASYTKTSGSTTTPADLANGSVYTINSSGTHRTMTQAISDNANLFTRYNDSKEAFVHNSLATANSAGTSYTTNAYIYGLHFMDSTISKNSIVNAEKVSILGNKCDTYQFPVDCIDFNLKQKGIINFFAGTYFTDNDSFFSLHEIIRNNDAVVKGDPEDKEFTSYNTINDIKEIEEIYGNDEGEKTTKYSNIYKYKGATGNNMYSVPYRIDGNQNKYVMNKTNTTDSSVAYSYATMGQSDFETYCATYGYELKFKTSQIGKQNSSYTTNRIYYFEFPMNPGEYCLGSVPGGTGAYLLYLDIGANAAKTQRTTIYEHFAEIKKVFEYPAGVAVVSFDTLASNIQSGTELDETNTSNFIVLAGNASVGTAKVSRSGNDVELARAGGLLTSAKPTLVGDLMWDNSHQQYNIHDPGGNNLSDEITSEDTVSDIRRLQYYDWNVNLEELTITYITDTSTDGGSTYERTFYQKYQNGTDTTTFSEMKIYNTTSGTKYTEADLSNPATSSVKTYAGADETSVNTTLMLKITYEEDDGEVLTTEWVVNLVLVGGEGGHYYTISSTQGTIVLQATLNEGSVTINILSLGTGKDIYINNSPITSTGTVTITP